MRPIHNKGGAVGAWLADLLLYLFGISAWWWVFAGVVLVVTGYRHLTRSIDAADRHHPWLAVPGFALVLLSSAALEALRLYRLPASLPHAPGGALGEMIGSGFSRALGFNGATLLLIALFAIGWSLFTGMSWLRLMERVGAGIERLIASLRQRRERAAIAKSAPRRSRSASSSSRRRAKASRIANRSSSCRRWSTCRSRSAWSRKSRSRCSRTCPIRRCRRWRCSRTRRRRRSRSAPETLEFTSRLIERKLADFGVSVKVLAAYPGPVITRFEIEPAVGVKGARSST